MAQSPGGAPEIAILLPHGEHFGPERAGAIALHVRDVTRASRLQQRIRIYGAPLDAAVRRASTTAR